MRWKKAVALSLFVCASGGRAQTLVFTKDVVRVNGVTVTSAPATLTNGDTIDFKMTYRFSPGQPAQARIEDMLSPALQFVPLSWQVPAGWPRQWHDGTAWQTAEPATVTGLAAEVKAPNMAPLGTGQTAAIPAPPSGTVTTTASGDGYRPIVYNGRVYMLNHHTAGNYLDCRVVATGAQCLTFPVHVPLSGTFSASSTDNGTPGKPLEYLDHNTGRLYFPVENLSPHEFGVLCADLITGQSCGFTKIENNPNGTATGSNFGTLTDAPQFQGAGAVGTRVYVQLPGGRLGCVDTAPSTPVLCAGQPYSLISTTVSDYDNDSLIVGNKIISTWRTTSGYRLTCFDTANNQQCAGWTALAPDPTGLVAILYPLLNASGALIGACVHTTNPTTSTVFKCYDPATSGLLTLSVISNYSSWAATYSGGFYQTSGYGQPGYYGTRVFNGAGTGQTIGCFDFATGSACTAGFPVANTPQRYYSTVPDPERPGCMWYYSDDKLLGSFRASDGQPCSDSTLDMTVTPAASYCAGGSVSSWDQLSVSGLTLGSGVTATLTIYDGSNPTALAVKSNLITPYAQNLPISALPINLGASGLNIGYGIGPGRYTSLRFVLQFNGITNHAPWSQTIPPNAEVTWVGDPLEFCFRAVVRGCEVPLVTNQATAVTTPVSGTAMTNLAPTPAFQATHLTGKDCPATLIVKKAIPGVPAGYSGTFQFHVTCSSSSGLVQQLVSIAWPSTSITVPGLQAGSTCTVSEDPSLPPPPSGYSWSGLPVVNPTGGVIVLGNGTNQVSFTNNIRACNDRGRIKITKVVQNPPSGFSGTFTFNVSCWSGTTLTTQQVQIAYPGSSVVFANGIPLGSSCTVTEASPLPALPGGWFWEPPSYSPASGQVVLIGTCCPEVVVTNIPKFCCRDDHPVDVEPTAGGVTP